MKTILIPTDFSDCAKNAANFALNFAKKEKIQFILFNAFYIRTAESQIMIDVTDILEKEVIRDLEAERVRLQEIADVPIDIQPMFGSVIESIRTFSETIEADLIVMGTNGEVGMLDKQFGSTTYGIIKSTKVPVLAIPPDYDYEQLSQMIFAWDQHPINKQMKDDLMWVKDVLSLDFKVIHVSDEIQSGDNLAVMNFSDSISDELDFMMVKSKQVVKTLENYSSENSILSIVSREHDLLDRLFNKSVTKNILNRAAQPVFIVSAE